MNYKELFEALAAYLIQHGYELVVNQVREELATGRLSEEKISTLAEVTGYLPQRPPEGEFRKGLAAEFVRRTEYSDADSVVLLLEASRRAITEATVMAAELRETLLKDGITSLGFQPERADEVGYDVIINASISSSLAREQGAAIDRLILEIRSS